jgi:8-oxo-dGTP diphosphatase
VRERFTVVVHLLAVAEGRLLLVRRAGTGRGDGLWAPPGGHLEAGELPTAAVLRECAEESGLYLSPRQVVHCATLAYEDDGVGLNLLFLAELDRRASVRPEPGSASEAGWHAFADLPAERLPWLDDALARRTEILALGRPDAPWYGEAPVSPAVS